ncbi:MAG TPA: biotin/lipoyl-containing protein [Pleomorphomonadaceae bacterium]|jgi:acetyl-CoA carboxylase biotin carboxyl carrier protein|nr:biotin/lipoyl-containing protein [Pleomorphomonadaceae bacterium]
MAKDPILDAVDALTGPFLDSGLAEMEVEVGGITVRLARPRPPAAPAPAATPATPFGEAAPGHRFVTAPLTGVWYPAPSPGARPYLVLEGEVSVGQVVGLIEAMKLFNEIKSDVAGTVSRVMADNGMLVKRQQPLFEVRLA